VDIHLHDRGELGAKQIEMICALAIDLPHSVNISHCFGLTTVDEIRTAALLETMSSASVTVTTVAPGTTPPIPLQQMKSHGVGLGLGQDGIRDYWSPYGTADMLDRTWQLAFTNGFRHDDLIEECVIVATSGGAAIMGIGGVGLSPGDIADLVVVPGDTVTAAVMDRAPRTMVVKSGAVVAREGVLV
jgi:cytosine/adenosine deaminase-related metal-dependent hydrolase